MPPGEYHLEDDGRLMVNPAGYDHEIAYWTGYDLSADPLSPMAQQIVGVARSLTPYVENPIAANILSQKINGEYSVTFSRSALSDRDRAVAVKVRGLGAALELGFTTPSYLLDRTAEERAAMFGDVTDQTQTVAAMLKVAGVLGAPSIPQLVMTTLKVAGVLSTPPGSPPVISLMSMTGMVGDHPTPSPPQSILSTAGMTASHQNPHPLTAALLTMGVIIHHPLAPPPSTQSILSTTGATASHHNPHLLTAALTMVGEMDAPTPTPSSIVGDLQVGGSIAGGGVIEPTPSQQVTAEELYYAALSRGARISFWEADLVTSQSASIEEAMARLKTSPYGVLGCRVGRRRF